MLELRDATYRYPQVAARPGGSKAPREIAPALRHITLSVSQGEKVGVLGANGSGKSTALRLMSGRAFSTEGAMCLDGQPVLAHGATLSAVRRRVGMVGQDPDDQLVASTVFEEVAFGPCNLGLPVEEVRERVESALRACDLAGLDDVDVSTLSGGQRQRLAIAGALAMHPNYLLCDEPCSMLDPSSRQGVLEVLRTVRREGCGVVYVTHELSEVLDCDRVVILDGGSLVWEGAPSDMLTSTALQERSACLTDVWTRSLAALLNAGLLRNGDPLWDSCGCARALCARGPEVCARARDVLAAASGASRTEAHGSHPMRGLVGEDLGYTYSPRPRRGNPDDEACWAVRHAHAEVASGEVLLVAGRTGSGKSTLARMLSGLVKPSEGTVALDGAPVVPGRVGCTFQRAADQLFADSVLEDVALGPRNMGRPKREATARARAALEQAGLEPDLYGSANTFSLSGGEQRRVVLAGMLAMDAPFAMLDEPTVGLDARGLAELRRMVDGLASQGVGVAVVSHDAERLAPMATKAMLMEGGRVQWRGGADELPTRLCGGAGSAVGRVEELRSLLDASSGGGSRWPAR